MDLNAQKEQFSMAYVRAVAAVAAVKVTRAEVDDDSVDVTLERSSGCAPRLDLQLKCTGVEDHPVGEFSFPLEIKNYDDLRRETLAPRWLVLAFVPKRSADWFDMSPAKTILRYHARWVSLAGFPDVDNAHTVTVALSSTNIFTPEAVQLKLTEVEAAFHLP